VVMGAEWPEKSSFGLSRPLSSVQLTGTVNVMMCAGAHLNQSAVGGAGPYRRRGPAEAPEISARQRRTRQKKVTAAWLV